MHHLLTVIKMGIPHATNPLMKPVTCVRTRSIISHWSLTQQTTFGNKCACHRSLVVENRTDLKLCPIAFQYYQKRDFTSLMKLYKIYIPTTCKRSNQTSSGAKESKYSKSLQQHKVNEGERTSVVSGMEENCFKGEDHRQLMSELEDLYKDATFHPIFQFPLILVARLISRLKIMQTVLTIMVLPPVTYGYLSGTTSLAFVQLSYSVATLAAVVLYAMSYYFRRLIGVVSISEDERVIRVGRLTFWGNRKNLYYYVDDVVPLSDLPDDVNEILIKFKTYRDPNLLYISLTHGKIKDKEKFAKVFGST